MAYPYTTTAKGLKEALNQLRTTFPATVTAETLKKWGIASNNEGTVLSVIRFLGIIDDKGHKQVDAAKIFVEHDDESFASKFGELVAKSYQGLFDDWGDKAWTLDRSKLISYFALVP